MKNPKTGMVHVIKSAEDMIDFNEASMTTLEQLNKINPESEEKKKQREEWNAANVKKLKAKVERRRYNEMTGNIAGFENRDDIAARH